MTINRIVFARNAYVSETAEMRAKWNEDYQVFGPLEMQHVAGADIIVHGSDAKGDPTAFYFHRYEVDIKTKDRGLVTAFVYARDWDCFNAFCHHELKIEIVGKVDDGG